MTTGANPAVFIDKDGTLIPDIPYNVDPRRITLSPGADEGLLALSRAGYQIVVVTNQSGIARGFFEHAALSAVESRIRALLRAAGVPLAGFYYCPHGPAEGCLCRKPAPGMLEQAASCLRLDLARSWLIGDIQADIEAGVRAGCRTVLVQHGTPLCIWPPAQALPDFVVPNLASAAAAILGCRCPVPGHRRVIAESGQRIRS